MSHTLRIVLLSTVCALAGCSGIKTDVGTEAPPGYRADAASWAASVDWTRTKIVTVDMDEYDFVPSSLSLEAGKPYRLHLGSRQELCVAVRHRRTNRKLDVGLPYLPWNSNTSRQRETRDGQCRHSTAISRSAISC